MSYQYNWRGQRPRGLKIKQALQVVFVLAICLWLLYQIKHSRNNRKGYNGGTQNQLMDEQNASMLGRKGDAGWAENEGEADTKVVKLMEEKQKKEDGGAGDDELDRHPEERNEEDSYLKESKDTAPREEMATNTQERGYQELQRNTDNIPDIEVSKGVETKSTYMDDNFNTAAENAVRSVGNHAKYADQKVSETLTQVLNNEKDFNVSFSKDKDEAAKKNIENEDPPETEAKYAALSGVLLVNGSVPDQIEVDHGVHRFHDENGVPLDVNVVLRSRQNELNEGQKNIIIQGNISGSSNQSRIVEDIQIEDKDVESKGAGIAAHVKTDSRGTLNTSSIAKIDAETSMASTVKDAADAEEGKTTRDSHSVSSQQELVAITSGNMFTQSD